MCQKFRKGVGGQRGLARTNLAYTRDWGLFSAPFFLSPLRRRGTHFWRAFLGSFLGSFWGFVLSQTPSRQPLFETSEFEDWKHCWLHLNPVTINPVIRMSHLGPFFCPRDSELLSEQSRARSLQPLFWSAEWASEEAPSDHPWEVKFPQT